VARIVDEPFCEVKPQVSAFLNEIGDFTQLPFSLGEHLTVSQLAALPPALRWYLPDQ
jgi:hypothetical protein